MIQHAATDFGHFFREEDIPPKILEYLKQQKALPPKERDFQPLSSRADAPFETGWPPRGTVRNGIIPDAIIGSEIIKLSVECFGDPNQSFASLDGFKTLLAGMPDNVSISHLGRGDGFPEQNIPLFEREARIVFRKVSDRFLQRRLKGFYCITKPNCLILGEDVYRIFERLKLFQPNRIMKVRAYLEKTDDFLGYMYLFDPEVRKGLIDFEHSQSRWVEWPGQGWMASPSCSPSITSFLPGNNISIVRAALGRDIYFCSKDLIHTLIVHGVKIPEHNQHEVYFNHAYKPKDLLADIGEA